MVACSPETRAKISAARMGHEVSAETRAKISQTKRAQKVKLTEEHKAQALAAITGRPVSAKTRAKIGNANRGRVISAAGRENMRQAHLGKRLTDEHKRKLSEAFRGERSGTWTGDAVGYHGVHKRLYATRGYPTVCEHCGTDEGRLHWALNHVEAATVLVDERLGYIYSVWPSDYMALCPRCHARFDRGWISGCVQ